MSKEELKEKKVEEPKTTNNEVPHQMRDNIKTSVQKMSHIIQNKLQQLNDLASAELLLDSNVRMKNRLESIRKMSSAQHIKIRGKWKTTPPQMHIKALTGRKINNDEYEITFGVYETDEKGEKKLYTNYGEVTLHNGDTIKRPLSADYKVAYEVVEKIKTGKPITREVIEIDDM